MGSPPSRLAVVLDPWTLNDASELSGLYAANREELSVSEPWRPSDFYTEAGQRRRITEVLARKEVLNFVIRQGGAIEGTLGFEGIAAKNWTADLGYWVDAAHRRRGIAATAVGLAVNYGFKTLGLSRIQANVEPDNIASQRVLERNSFRCIGQRSIDLQGSPFEWNWQSAEAACDLNVGEGEPPGGLEPDRRFTKTAC